MIEWKDAAGNNIDYVTSGYGLQQSYDGSGYMKSIDYGLSRAEYIAFIDGLLNESTFFS